MHLTPSSHTRAFLPGPAAGFLHVGCKQRRRSAMTASSIVEEFYAVQQPATYNIRYSEALKVLAGAVSDSSSPELVTIMFTGVAHTRHIHKAIHLRVCLEAAVSCITCQLGALAECCLTRQTIH